MTPIEIKQAKCARPWRRMALAGLGWLSICLCATAQVSVDTIGGGVRVECGRSSGFVGGNTYDTAQFNGPWSCALDTNGNLWIADKTNACIEQVTQAGNKADSLTIQYVTNVLVYTTNATTHRVTTNYQAYTNITGVAVDPGNNLYVLLPSPPEVKKYALTALSSPPLILLSDLVLTNTPFGAAPAASAMTVDANSNVFVAFTNGVIIRYQLLDSNNGQSSVYTKNYTNGAGVQYIVAGGFPWQPSSLTLRADGQLAVSDTLSNAIYIVSTNSSSTSGPQLLSGANGTGYAEGDRSQAQFDTPRGLAAASDGSLLVCDTMNNRVRAIDTNGTTSWLYGTASNVWPATCCDCAPAAYYAGWVDGLAGLASNNASGRLPASVAISPNGSLFVTELYYNLIRQVTNITYAPVVLNATLPVTTTGAATGITATNATFSGTVNAGGEATSYYFQWGTANNYTNFTATNQLTTNLTNTINVSATVTNLVPAVNYYFLLVAFNGLGVSTNTNYVTVIVPAEPATVVTLPATAVTASSATFNATVDPENSPTEVYFQWGTTLNYGNITTPMNLSSNLLNTTNISATVNNLQAGAIYYFQVVAYNGAGSSAGSGLTAITPATVPVADTEQPSGLTATNLTLNGSLVQDDESASYYFEWGPTTSYGYYTTTNLLTNNGAGPLAVSAVLSGLSPATEYHFQLVAFNNVGVGYGGDLAVTTPYSSAFVVTQPATGVTNTSATLNATINPEGSPTEVYFQWGTTSNYGNATTPINLTTNLTNTLAVSSTISNLQSGTTYYYQAVSYNSGGMSEGSGLIFNTPYVPPPIISISPSSGYFPDCVTIYVTSSVQMVYYTTNGATPSTNSAVLLMTNAPGSTNSFFGTIEWCNPQLSLTALQLLAGIGTNTTLVQGGYPTNNLIGFPQLQLAGPGAHVYIPVVVELQSNTTLESLQFRVEINTNQGGEPNIESVALQPLTPNDLVALPGPAPANAPVAFQTFPYTTSSNGLGLVITAEGGSSGLNMQGSGVVVLLHFQVPISSTYGQSYSLSVLDPSGTSDGQQEALSFTSMATQTLTNMYTPFMVGDSSPSIGYNAQQFGIKGISANDEEVGLDNADVNNAIYASIGIRVPPSDSDIFNSMDAYPPDSAGHGGDGLIQFLDWETILGRSVGSPAIYLGMDTNNYLRFWTNGDTSYRSHSVFTNWIAGESPVPLSLEEAAQAVASGPAKLSESNSPPGLVWFCQASVGSGTIMEALPGNTYALPVYVNVLPGYSLAGMQFRAIVTGSSGAPAVTSIQFNPAGGVSDPLILPGLSGNDKVHAWSFGSFATALEHSNYLGTISFQVPAGAAVGSCYALHFSGVDGAPDFTIDYQMESHPGYVWVMSAAQQPASITSDEWKIAFFGSLTNSQAGDNVDADGDGALNWQEYLAGTNPTNALSRFQFSSASLYTDGVRGVAINWLTAPGKSYLLQSSPALAGANWTSINTNSGDGNEYQCIVTNLSGNAHFYQILLQP
jgi:hypothetical protein